MNDDRIRTRPHMAGSWPCHIYISFEFDNDAKLLFDQIYKGLCESNIPSKIQLETSPHTSLSKTFYAKHWHLELLTRKLQELFNTLDNPLKDTPLSFDHWSAYENQEKTRQFLAIDCNADTSQYLKLLTGKIDRILAGFGYEVYYKDPKFHCSLFWTTCNDNDASDVNDDNDVNDASDDITNVDNVNEDEANVDNHSPSLIILKDILKSPIMKTLPLPVLVKNVNIIGKFGDRIVTFL